MRPIKFRCFFYDGKDYSTGRMITALESFNENYIEFTEDGELIPTDDCTIMIHFTGLHDKNGKEIYEGDVCQITLRKKYGHQLDGVPAKVGVVEFSRICLRKDTLYCFDTFHINERSIEYLIGQELEVIGNIYENPELVNSESFSNT